MAQPDAVSDDSSLRTESDELPSPVVGLSVSDVSGIKTVVEAQRYAEQLPDPDAWVWPFEQYGDDDPFSAEQEAALMDETVRSMRVNRAKQVSDKPYSQAVVSALEQAEAVSERLAELQAESVESDADDASDEPAPSPGVVADAGDMLATPDRIISPDNDYQLHDNVAVDLVKYIRSNTVRNEQQFLLSALAYVSGLSDDPGEYISSVLIGTSSSGKTHLRKQVDRLFAHLNVMDASTGSDKSLIYDDEWDTADIISMGELNQPSDEMIEFMKRAHGGDGTVNIRSTRGNPATGFDTETIEKEPKSYHFTFAQWEADFEFWNRLLRIPVHESESKNRAVGRMSFGHGDIQVGDGVQYGYDFSEGTERLQAHMLDIKRHAPGEVVIPTGGEFDWDAWDIIEPIFNHSRSESNRVYGMMANLVKASARLNFQSRETVTYTERTPTGETVEREAIVADPQDVANVLRCLETLRATTHEIDPRKRAVIEAVKVKSEEQDGTPADTVEGTDPIVEYLDESDASQVMASELDNIISDLEENYLLSTDGDTIQARNWDALGMPRVESNASLFEPTVDPVDNEPFLASWHDLRDEMITDGDDLLAQAGAEVRSEPDDLGVDDGGPGVVDQLDSWKQTVCELMDDALSGRRLTNLGELPVEAFIGLTAPSEPDLSAVETRGTVLDPTHELWDVEGKPADWVSSETDARRRIQQAIQEALAVGVVSFSEVHETDADGTPVDVTVRVHA